MFFRPHPSIQLSVARKHLATFLLSLLFCHTGRAAIPTWTDSPISQIDLSTPASVTAVSTVGTLVGAVNAGGTATTVNGVPFQAGSGNMNFSHSTWAGIGGTWGNNAGGIYTTNAGTVLNSANSWLDSIKYVSTSQSSEFATLNLLGLSIGQIYQVQLFFADIRSVYSVNGRSVSLDGGLTKHPYAFCPSGGPYGYLLLTGVFTADATTQAITMMAYDDAGNAVGPQINAYQIRNIPAGDQAPVIISSPQEQSGIIRGSASFSVTATGTPAPTYQWFHADTAIAGATTQVLHLTNLSPSDAGLYHVVVTNPAASIPSIPVGLQVIDPLDPAMALDAYNTVWTSPGQSDRDAMPVGNGEVGLMLWAESNGDLQFYIARTDSRTELDRLVKLGKVRVHFSPNPFATGQPFRQVLHLHEGRVEITAGAGPNQISLQVFVDSDSPTIHVSGSSSSPVTVSATYENWRNAQYTGNVGSSPLNGATGNFYESADIVDAGTSDRLLFHHRNDWSCVAQTAQLESMGAYLNQIPDTLANKTFGGVMTLTGAAVSGTSTLMTTSALSDFDLKITTLTAQTAALADWKNQITALDSAAPEAAAALTRTEAWWNDYWSRSWLFVNGDSVSRSPSGVNGRPLQIGAASDGSSKFTGSMARCSFYNRALTASEVASLAQGSPDSAAGVTEGLVESWLLGSTTNGVCVGQKGSGLNLTVTGGSVTTALIHSVSMARFEGGYFSGTDDARFEPAAGMTQEAWIYLDAGDINNGRIFDKTTANQTDGYLFDLYPGRALRFYNGADNLSVASNTLPTAAWVHVVVTYDNTNGAKAMYVNGVVANQSTPAIAAADDAATSAVTRAYVLTKWMSACGARGNDPIMFNGSLWTVMPNTSATSISNNADYRNWGHTYFYQNTRLAYTSMLARGEVDFMKPFFDYYRRFWDLNRKRAIEWHGAEGQFNNEMTTTFGLLPYDIYGNYDRTTVPKWYTSNQWGGAVTVSPGLELLTMMFDRYAQTGDEAYLQSDILPYAQDLFRFIETRFTARDGNKIVLSPIHAVETYWNTTNSITVVAGMHNVLDHILALTANQLSPSQRSYFSGLKAATPDIPTQQVNSKTVFAPAQVWNATRQNVELPQMYPVFPYRCYGLGRPNLKLATDSFQELAVSSSYFKPFAIGGPVYVESYSGWQQLPMEAAMLGLTDQAKAALTQNCQLNNSGYRFHGMWGPIYDSVPDGDHGANILNTAQLMAFQTVGDKILLLPAWPVNWDVSFKFHAPQNTTVSGRYRDGVLEQLEVTPAERKKDLVMMAGVSVSATGSSTINGYDAWRLSRFSGHDLDSPSVWDPNADPDGDTMPNAIEYALGTDPLVYTKAAEITLARDEHVIAFHKGAAAATDLGVTYVIERSEDLITWNEVTPSSNDVTAMSYTLPDGGPHWFVRLKVKIASE